MLRTTGEELGDSEEGVQRPPRLVMSLEGLDRTAVGTSCPRDEVKYLMRMCAKARVLGLLGMWVPWLGCEWLRHILRAAISVELSEGQV